MGTVAALVHFDDLRDGRMLFLLWFEHPAVTLLHGPVPHPVRLTME